jgi:uncharacterized lipoprotein YajG
MKEIRMNSSAALSASAVLLAALIIVVGGRLLTGPDAKADVVSVTGNVTALTVEASNSNDVLLVLDGRSEELLVYKVENQTNVELHKKYNLSRLFSDARGRAAGKTK